MKGKIAFVVGAAAGYVLGARAGRKRYEQIRAAALAVWESPVTVKVREVTGDAVRERTDNLKERAGRAAGDAVASLISKRHREQKAAERAAKKLERAGGDTA